MYLKEEKGITVMTLVITIIVIVIIVTITMRTTSDLPDEAHYTKYMQIMDDVQLGVENAKILNAEKGTTEKKLTEGFTKVYLENAPEGFVSFGEADEKITGYLVNLEKINYETAEYGKAYNDFIEESTLTFGEKEYDVYVFDKEWTVYYVKGLKYDGSMNYTFK